MPPLAVGCLATLLALLILVPVALVRVAWFTPAVTVFGYEFSAGHSNGQYLPVVTSRSPTITTLRRCGSLT